MPISLDEFRFPRFVKYKSKEPFIEDAKAKFMDGVGSNLRRFHGESFPQSGYNPKANTTSTKPINLETEDYTLPPS